MAKKEQRAWSPVPIKPSRHPVPAGFSPDAKAWDVGDAIAIVQYGPEVGWQLVLSCKNRCPSMREVMTARQRLVPQDLQMAILVPPFSGHPEEGSRFVYVTEVDLPKVMSLEAPATPPPRSSRSPEPEPSALDYAGAAAGSFFRRPPSGELPSSSKGTTGAE